MITTSEIMLGSARTTFTLSLVNPSIGIILTSSTALLTSIAILITNDCISKLKLRYTQLREWMNVISVLNENFSKTSMVEKMIGEKESLERKQIQNPYLDE